MLSQPITETTLEHLAALATPHMRAINNAITAAFPEQSDAMFTTAITLYFKFLPA